MRLGGMLDANACDKGAHFIALCDAFGLPLVSFIDVPGFSIGSGAERTNLGRRSAKLIFEWGQPACRASRSCCARATAWATSP